MNALHKYFEGRIPTGGSGQRCVMIFWGVLSAVTDRFSVASLSGILLSASFLSVVGLGQMFVVTTGRGNIDLSIAAVVTLSAYIVC